MSILPSATSSKVPIAGALRRLIRTAAAACLPALLGAGLPQAVDCVAAYVNRRAITLTDLRILRAFQLDEGAPAGAVTPMPSDVLQKAIDRLVVVDLMRGNFPVPQEEVEARLAALKARLAPDAWSRLLAEFGITERGLQSYLESILQYERMVAIRFGQPPEVAAEEVKDYYDREYAQAQKASGLEPKPMSQVLGEIGQRLRERKRDAQVSAWIQGLRGQAEIGVHNECLAGLR